MKVGKKSMDSGSFAGLGSSRFRIPSLPIEWLDGQSWRLPSGKALAEFALQTGFLAPMLMKVTLFGAVPPRAQKKDAEHPVATRETR